MTTAVTVAVRLSTVSFKIQEDVPVQGVFSLFYLLLIQFFWTKKEVKALYDKSTLPYIQEYDYRFIKTVRQLRNKTLSQFSEVMNVDPATISKLENNQLEFTPLYESKFKEAIKQLEISNIELLSVRKIIEMKALKGY